MRFIVTMFFMYVVVALNMPPWGFPTLSSCFGICYLLHLLKIKIQEDKTKTNISKLKENIRRKRRWMRDPFNWTVRNKNIKLNYKIYTIYMETWYRSTRPLPLPLWSLRFYVTFDQADLEDLVSFVSSMSSGPYTLCVSFS